MMEFFEININIFEINALVRIEKKLTNLYKLLNIFPKAKTKNFSAGVIEIHSSRLRELKVSQDWQKAIISGPDLNNIDDHFNQMGLLMFIIRFIGLHLTKKGIFLLHGSSVLSENGKVLFFGDDGQSKAKTLSSLELALKSNKYIGDELCFYHSKTKKIHGFSFVPIHIRPEVERHLIIEHNFSFPLNTNRSRAGFFIKPSEIFKYVPNAKLDTIIYTHFAKQERVEKLSLDEAYKSLKICMLAHFLKLLNPCLDHLQFLHRKDSTRDVFYPRNLLENLENKLNMSSLIKKTAQEIPSYKISLKQPCNLTHLLPF